MRCRSGPSSRVRRRLMISRSSQTGRAEPKLFHTGRNSRHDTVPNTGSHLRTTADRPDRVRNVTQGVTQPGQSPRDLRRPRCRYVRVCPGLVASTNRSVRTSYTMRIKATATTSRVAQATIHLRETLTVLWISAISCFIRSGSNLRTT